MTKSILIYSFSFLVSIFFAVLYQKVNLRQKKIRIYNELTINALSPFLIYIVIIFFPVFIGAVRQNIGTDYENYLLNFNILQQSNIKESLSLSREPLFTLLNYSANFLFNGESWGVFLLSSLITMFFIILTLDYYKKDLSIPMGLFIFYMLFYIISLNIIRQMIAVSIVLYAYRFILERKPIQYLLLIIIAANFHLTAIVCSLFYLLAKKNNTWSKIKKIIFYLLIILFPMLINPILRLMEFIPYLNTYSSRYSFSFEGYNLSFIINIMPIIVPGLIFKRKIIEKNPNFEFFINLSLLSIPFYLLSSYQFWISRLVYYVSSIQIILIPIILHTITKKSNRRISNILVIAYYIIYFIYIYIYIGSQESFPYQSFIDLLNTN